MYRLIPLFSLFYPRWKISWKEISEKQFREKTRYAEKNNFFPCTIRGVADILTSRWNFYFGKNIFFIMLKNFIIQYALLKIQVKELKMGFKLWNYWKIAKWMLWITSYGKMGHSVKSNIFSKFFHDHAKQLLPWYVFLKNQVKEPKKRIKLKYYWKMSKRPRKWRQKWNIVWIYFQNVCLILLIKFTNCQNFI